MTKVENRARSRVTALKIVSAADALAAVLRERILDGEFKSGEPIREVLVSETYGVARHTVRSACSVLAHERLLRREPNRGMFVPALSEADIRELYWIRDCLEVPSMERLAEAGTAVPEAEEYLREFELLTPESPWSRVVETDLAFHRALVKAAGSERLSRMYDSITSEISLAFVQLQPRYAAKFDLAQEHRSLLDTLARCDAALAAAAIRQHLDAGLNDILHSVCSRATGPKRVGSDRRSA